MPSNSYDRSHMHGLIDVVSMPMRKLQHWMLEQIVVHETPMEVVPFPEIDQADIAETIKLIEGAKSTIQDSGRIRSWQQRLIAALPDLDRPLPYPSSRPIPAEHRIGHTYR